MMGEIFPSRIRGPAASISTAFPNTLGPAGGVDNLTSFTDFIGEVYAGCKLVTTRMDDGQKRGRSM